MNKSFDGSAPRTYTLKPCSGPVRVVGVAAVAAVVVGVVAAIVVAVAAVVVVALVAVVAVVAVVVTAVAVAAAVVAVVAAVAIVGTVALVAAVAGFGAADVAERETAVIGADEAIPGVTGVAKEEIGVAMVVAAGVVAGLIGAASAETLVVAGALPVVKERFAVSRPIKRAAATLPMTASTTGPRQIGRASCRERVLMPV